MTIEHLKIARLVERLMSTEGDFTDEEVTGIAWAEKNADWLGLSGAQLNDPRLVRLLNLVEDVYFNRVPDPTGGATEYSYQPKQGEVVRSKIGQVLFY